jgi:hypothetical protein
VHVGKYPHCHGEDKVTANEPKITLTADHCDKLAGTASSGPAKPANTMVDLVFENTTNTLAKIKIKDFEANKTLDALWVKSKEIATFSVKAIILEPTTKKIDVRLDLECFSSDQKPAGNDSVLYLLPGKIQIKTGCKLPTNATN